MVKMNRRTFLKGTAAGVAAMAAGLSAPAVFSSSAVANASSAGEWKAAFCSACHSPHCGTLVKVINDVAVEIKGDPKSLINEGMLCPRGNAVLSTLYHPYRVQRPMKRTNPEKGLDIDPGWTEITWEEALDTVSKNLKEARDYDPNSLLCHVGFGNEDARRKINFEAAFGTANRSTTSGPLCPDHYSALAMAQSKGISPDLNYTKLALMVGGVLDQWPASSGRATQTFVDAVERGMKVICIDPHKQRAAQNGEWVPILPGTDIVLGWSLLRTILYEHKVWDAPFLKKRTNAPYLIADKPQVFDGAKTLIEDYLRDPATNKPLVWDEQLGQAVPFDSADGMTYALQGEYEVNGQKAKPAFQIIYDYIADYTPEWAEPICTIPAAKIREIAKELVDNAMIGSTITIDGHTLPYRPVAIYVMRGANCNPLNTEVYKSFSMIQLCLGAMDVPGGSIGARITSPKKVFPVDEDQMLMPEPTDHMANQYIGRKSFNFPPTDFEVGCFYPMKLSTIQLVWHSVLDPASYHIPYEAKVLMLCGANSFRSNVEWQVVSDAMRKIPFTFSIALYYDEPTQFADILLPEHHPLERAACMKGSSADVREGSRQLRNAAMFRRRVVEPVFDTRAAEDIYMELAQRVGFLDKINTYLNDSFFGRFLSTDKTAGLLPELHLDAKTLYKYEDIVERKIKTIFGMDAGWHTFAESSTHNLVTPTIGQTYFHIYKEKQNIRVPLYWAYSGRNIKTIMQGMEKHGVKFPHADINFVAKSYSSAPQYFQYETMLPTAEYPFKVFQFKTDFQVNDQTGLVYSHWLREVENKFDPNVLKIWVPASRVAELGLKEDDEITLESYYGGKTSGKVHLSEMIHPQSVAIVGKWGARGTHITPFAKQGPCYNDLLNGDERDIGFLMGNVSNSVPVKIIKKA